MKSEITTKTIQQLLQAFQTQEFPENVAYVIIRRSPDELRIFPCRRWSFLNTMIMVSNQTDTAMGFRQWNALNRHVVKGTRAFHILVPLLKRYTPEPAPDTDTDDASEVTQRVYGFKAVPVFRYEDTDGEPLPVKESYKPVHAPAFIEVAKNIGVQIDYGPVYANFLGYYASAEKRIHLCSHTDVVFFHELAHAMHDYLGLADAADRQRKEIVAEFSAAVLARIAGLTGYEGNAYQYIARYADGDSPEQVLRHIAAVIKDIEAVVTAVLRMSEPNIGGIQHE